MNESFASVFAARFYITENVSVEEVVYDDCSFSEVKNRSVEHAFANALPISKIVILEWDESHLPHPDFLLIAQGHIDLDKKSTVWSSLY